MIKGLIFAAGLGTRLRPLTDTRPKALVEVGGCPMLRRVIDAMAAAGVDEIVVNAHHFADMVIGYLDSIKNKVSPRITVSDERNLLLDTGGGLLRAESLLAGAEAIVLHNADILTDAPLADMVSAHLASRSDATLLVDPCRRSSRLLLFDEAGRMHGRINLTTGVTTPGGIDTSCYARAAFGGVHVVSPRIFQALRSYAASGAGEVFSITDFYCREASALDLRAFRAPEKMMWFDIGRPESLARAEEFIARASS